MLPYTYISYEEANIIITKLIYKKIKLPSHLILRPG